MTSCKTKSRPINVRSFQLKQMASGKADCNSSVAAFHFLRNSPSHTNALAVGENAGGWTPFPPSFFFFQRRPDKRHSFAHPSKPRRLFRLLFFSYCKINFPFAQQSGVQTPSLCLFASGCLGDNKKDIPTFKSHANFLTTGMSSHPLLTDPTS